MTGYLPFSEHRYKAERESESYGHDLWRCLEDRVDDELKRLAAELAEARAEAGRLREALEPFARQAQYWADIEDTYRVMNSRSDSSDPSAWDGLTLADIRAARAALEAP